MCAVDGMQMIDGPTDMPVGEFLPAQICGYARDGAESHTAERDSAGAVDVAGEDTDHTGALSEAADERGSPFGVAELKKRSRHIRHSDWCMMQKHECRLSRASIEQASKIGLPLGAETAEVALGI